MKIIIAFALFVVGISALPKFNTQIDLKNERLVTDAIASAIQDLSQSIKDAGLDPYYIKSDSGTVELPVPVIFSATGVVENFLFNGLSNIVINNLSFSIITYRLRFDIVLPQIAAALDKAELDVTLFGEEYTASAAGSLSINNVRLVGDIRVSVGIISGISIRSIDMNFTLGGIQSNLDVKLQNWNPSNQVNTFLGSTIPLTLNNFASEMNELIEIIALDIANEIL